MFLPPGVSLWNIYSIFLLNYTKELSYGLQSSYETLLLQDRHYYEVDEHELGQVQGNYKSIAIFVSLPFIVFSGYLFDRCGPKLVLGMATFVMTVCAFTLPYGETPIPGLLVIHSIIHIGSSVVSASPLLVTYVDDRSKGLANTYNFLVGCLSNNVFTFGFMQLAKMIPLFYISVIAGGISFLIFIYVSVFVLK